MNLRDEAADDFLELESAPRPTGGYVVVHPLHDAPEVKVDLDRLGPMQLSRGARIALVSLRCYLVAIMLMGAWRAIELIKR